jgi:hypothetical protein
MSALTIHRDADRNRFFRDNLGRGPVRDDETGMWLVTNPEQCRVLISSRNLRPATYGEDYTALQARFGGYFSAMTFAFAHTPLCLHGQEHIEMRRRVAGFLAPRKAQISARIRDSVRARMAPLTTPGRVEVMGGVVRPIVRDVISSTIDIDLERAGDTYTVSSVFDRSIGMGKRRRIAAQVSALKAFIEDAVGHDAADVGMRLALIILGQDSLVGTLGESLYRLILDNPGLRLSEIDYPEVPPFTGVPFIDRIVLEPFELEGRVFAAGDRVRVYLQSYAYGADDDGQQRFFSAGAHTCLGRPVSLELWAEMTALLKTVDLRADVTNYSEMTENYVFLCPQVLEVNLCP